MSIIFFFISRVFANCHQDIIRSFRRILLCTFCDQSFLEYYIERNIGQHIVAFNVESQLQEILESETVEQIINKELHALSLSSEGQMLSIIGLRTTCLKPLIRPFIMNVASEVIPGLIEDLTAKVSNVLELEIEQNSYDYEKLMT